MNSENNPVADQKTKKSTKAKSNKMIWAIVGGAVALVAVIVLIVVLVVNRPKEEDEIIVVNGQTLTEEERHITKETIAEYIEMEVKGVQHFDAEDGGYDAVVIDVKNKGDKATSLAIDVIARDPNTGDVLDTWVTLELDVI